MEEQMCQGCINCDGTHTFIMSYLSEAYDNGVTDVVAKVEGVIPNNDHKLTVLRFMCDDIMAELTNSVSEYTAAATQAAAERARVEELLKVKSIVESGPPRPLAELPRVAMLFIIDRISTHADERLAELTAPGEGKP